jgi:hypothetical protein
MGVSDVPLFLQERHIVADRRRAIAQAVLFDEIFRPNRKCVSDVVAYKQV